MRLSNIELDLIWHESLELIKLRKYILDKIAKHGEVLRWSINNIKLQDSKSNKKVLTINAVIIN